MKKEEEVRFSMRVVLEDKFGKKEKNIKTARATKRAQDKVAKTKNGDGVSRGKYNIEVRNGVKYMTLKK